MDMQSDSPSQSSPPPPSPRSLDGRSAPRSRNGCWTCRTKKVKCDEIRPQCRRCLRLKLLCDYTPRRKEARNGWQVVRSQRRRRTSDAERNGSNPAMQTSPSMEWLQSLLLRQDGTKSISTFRMPVLATSTSSVELTAADHEAIRYFRTSFAKLNHTKNPDYSLYSIMFKIAEVDPVVMHMVLAVGGREMEFQKTLQPEQEKGTGSPLWHYSKALKLMAGVIGNESSNRFNFDSIYTALYLMLLYEQRYGDDRCAGFINHLNGAALILKHQYGGEASLLPPSSRSHPHLALSQHADSPRQENPLSLYAARMIMWMVEFDALAAPFATGSQLHPTLFKLLSTSATVGPEILDKFKQLHRFSEPLYRTIWGKEYPQNELVDDVENRGIFFFAGACAQLRLIVSHFAELGGPNTEEVEERAAEVEIFIETVSTKYSELIEVAAGLSVATDNSHRLVANIRSIVPLFYAVVLYFLRLRSSPGQPLGTRQVEALRQIMNLAFQTHKYGGDKAMVRLAWPLFMVGLETNDHLHREWVLSRFSAISKFGLNFRRAYQCLVHVIDLQNKLGRRVDVRGELQSGEFGLFVI